MAQVPDVRYVKLTKFQNKKTFAKPKYISSMLYDFKDVCSTWTLEGYTVL